MQFIGQEMRLTGWHNGNEVRNVICVETRTSIEWSCCLFRILCMVACPNANDLQTILGSPQIGVFSSAAQSR